MLDATTVTEPAPEGHNDDFLLVSSRWALVLDGVSAYPVPDVGCRHGVPWFVAHLASHLGTELATNGDRSLSAVLASAIAQTVADHGPGCDLTHPLTPAATVAVARIVLDRLEYLVLGDATVAWQLTNGDTAAVTDDRADHLPDAPVVVSDVRRYDPEYVARVRNTPGGFWVAAADPNAALQSLTGWIPVEKVARIALYSDGITRLVERYGYDWANLFELAESAGARALVEAVRIAEQDDSQPERWRGKPHDDSTAVIARIV